MKTDRELMQQALRQLEYTIAYSNKEMSELNAVKHALRDRLAQLKSEPIKNRHVSYVCPNCHWSLDKREWVGLTDEELVNLTVKNSGYPTKLAADIEAKLKEKNT